MLYQPNFQGFILLHCAPTPQLSLSRHVCINIIRSNAKPRTGIKKVESVQFTAVLLLSAGPPTSESCFGRNIRRYRPPGSTAPRSPQSRAEEAHWWHQRLVSHGQNLCTLRDRGANLIEQVSYPLQSVRSALAASVRCQHT